MANRRTQNQGRSTYKNIYIFQHTKHNITPKIKPNNTASNKENNTIHIQTPKTQQIKLKMLDSDSNELPQQLHTQSNHNL